MKAGVIGLGSMGLVHLKILLSMNQFDEVYACEINQERIDQLKNDYPTVKFYSEIKDFFSNNLDFVSIVTLGSSHYELTKLAVQNDVKYILCEKPVATKLSDAYAMKELSKKSVIGVNQSRRVNSFFVSLKNRIPSLIGQIKSFYFSCGGGRLGCVGIHFLDIFNFLSDKKYISVQGLFDESYQGDHKGRDVFDPGAMAIYTMEDNVRAFVDITDDVGVGPIIVVTGEYGRIVIDQASKKAYADVRNEEDKEKRLGQYNLPLEHVELDYEDIDLFLDTQKMIESILQGNPGCSIDDSIIALEAVLGMHLKKGGLVTFPITDLEFEAKIT